MPGHLKAGLLTLGMAVVMAAPVHGFDWPWQGHRELRTSYCKGFTFAGLASYSVDQLSRVDLWLVWNLLNRTDPTVRPEDPQEFAAGRDRFNELAAGGDEQTLQRIAKRECPVGSS